MGQEFLTCHSNDSSYLDFRVFPCNYCSFLLNSIRVLLCSSHFFQPPKVYPFQQLLPTRSSFCCSSLVNGPELDSPGVHLDFMDHICLCLLRKHLSLEYDPCSYRTELPQDHSCQPQVLNVLTKNSYHLYPFCFHS